MGYESVDARPMLELLVSIQGTNDAGEGEGKSPG